MPLSPDPVPVAAPVPTNEYVQIPVTELARFQSAQTQLEEHRRQTAYQVAEQNTRLMATEGRISEITQRHQQELAAKDERVKQVTIASELANALSGYQLCDPSAATQLSIILSKELTAHEGANGLEVRSKDYRPVSDFIKDTLAKPTFAHFLSPNARQTQGAAPQPQHGQQAAPVGLPAEPRSLGEAIILQAMHTAANASNVDPRTVGGTTVEYGPGGARKVAQPMPAFGIRAVKG